LFVIDAEVLGPVTRAAKAAAGGKRDAKSTLAVAGLHEERDVVPVIAVEVADPALLLVDAEEARPGLGGYEPVHAVGACDEDITAKWIF